ncbi:MAG: DUF2079 domain-containing protein [Candidatus Bathyarchaeia archaeon]
MICLYTIFFSCFTILKHYSFRTYAWDLGIFNQAFWFTVKYGKLFYNTPELLINPSGNFLGIHFSPILFLILPAYAFYPSPETLLILQSFILALGAVPLYKLSMHVLKSRVASIAFVFVYLLYPPLHGVNWFDFHVQAFLPLFFLSNIYFLEKQNWKCYFVFTLLSLLCEEHVSFAVAFIGLLIALRYRRQLKVALKTRNFRDPIFSSAAFTVFLAIFWYPMTLWIRNTFFPINPSFLSTFKASANWDVLGASDPILIPIYIIFYPQRAINALQYDFLVKIVYLLILFGPLAFFSFHKAEYLLPTLPWFVYSLFSNYQPYYTIYDQYPAYVIAFIFVSALYSMSALQSSRGKTRKLSMIVLFSLVAYFIASPTSFIVNQYYDAGLRPASQHELFIHEILSYVPVNASIITQNNLFAHVSSRLHAYVVPVEGIWRQNELECKKFVSTILDNVDYVLVDIKTDYFASAKIFSILSKRTDFKVLVSADGIVLFKRDYDGKALILASYTLIYSYNNLNVYAGEIVINSDATSANVLHFNGSMGPAPLFWSSPRTLLPPGNYTVSLRMKINGTGELFKVELCCNGGQNVLESKQFYDFNVALNSWKIYDVYFSVTHPLTDFEIRAVDMTKNVDVYLDCIEITQSA